MTDKAAVEVPSPVAGRVAELGGEIGQMMAVGSVLIRIEIEADAASRARRRAAAARHAPGRARAAQQRLRRPRPLPAAAAAAHAGGTTRARLARGRASAPARWASISRSCAAVAPTAACCMPTSTPCSAAGARGPAATGGTREIKVIGLRRAIAQKMQESKRHIPHFTYVEEVDVTEIVALRDELNRQHAASRGELSPLAFVIRAVVRAVAAFPQVNARFDDEAGVLTLYDAVHLGVATQTDGGLMVPVLRQAQTLDLWASAAAIARLAAARAPARLREELTGSTITVTSLGKLGGIASTPVINHPEVAIVGVNRIVARPMVHDGRCRCGR